MTFTFIDLFAGIGGFHGALSSIGGECVWASEFDRQAATVYELNWGISPAGDIVPLTDPKVSKDIPKHDVLCAGFPCQPFSKSGKQRGFADSTRGTLFFNICQILEARKPKIVFLENVRNLAGPRQQDTWNTIISELRNLGYLVSDIPTVFSPHLLPESQGGRPQVRERVFIFGVYVGKKNANERRELDPLLFNEPIDGFDPMSWRIEDFLFEDSDIPNLVKYQLSDSEVRWIDAWDDFIRVIRNANPVEKIPGFPLWADSFKLRLPVGYKDLPAWKINFLEKNRDFYRRYQDEIDAWKSRWNNLEDFPPSRRKLEWQAQETESLWQCVMHLRPSGIRAKRPTYLPALVAITQTSIIGTRKRRLTPHEAKRLQGLSDHFDFGVQSDAASYKQLGNGVSVGAARYVFLEGILRNREELGKSHPELVRIAESHLSLHLSA
jgi:DNA (cytosine-5)-methyltransferase 1